MRNRSGLMLIAFLIVVVGGGIVIGRFTGPDAWFVALNKPSFNPPSWLFAPVWTLLYIMIAVAGWRVWLKSDMGAFGLWCVQLLLNFAWTPIFFTLHRIDWALGVIVLLLGTIVAFIMIAPRTDKPSAILFMPYGLWVTFATALNFAFWRLN